MHVCERVISGAHIGMCAIRNECEIYKVMNVVACARELNARVAYSVGATLRTTEYEV